MKKIAILAINFYQNFLSFDRGILRMLAPAGACRYPMSCSEYTREAILEYGILKGGWFGIRRMISCNPWTN